MKPTLLLLILAASPLFAETRISIGIGIGTPLYYAPPPPPIVAYPPPCPGLGYTWVAGYWYPVGSRYAWRAGYWALPPYAGAYWVAPRYHKHRYYSGYWARGGKIRYGDYDDGWSYRNRRYGRGYRQDHKRWRR